MTKKVDISYKTVVFTFLFLVSAWFLYYISDILMQLFVAVLISIVLNPTVTKLEKHKVPRALSIAIVYLSAIALFIFMIANIIPLLVDQTSNFARALPGYMSELNIPVDIVEELSNEFTAALASVPSQLLSLSVQVLSNVLAIVSVLIFALYFLLARPKLESTLSKYLPMSMVERIEKMIVKLERQLAGWARGQALLMFLIGLVTYIGLVVLGIPYALPLALLAGILEAIPNLGPIIAAIPAIIVGFGINPITGVAVLALSFLVQQVEAYLFVPKVMQRSADVNPIVTLLALIIGFKVYGVVGAVLSIPIAITIKVVVEDYLEHRNLTP